MGKKHLEDDRHVESRRTHEGESYTAYVSCTFGGDENVRAVMMGERYELRQRRTSCNRRHFLPSVSNSCRERVLVAWMGESRF